MSTCVANQMWKEKRMVKKDLWARSSSSRCWRCGIDGVRKGLEKEQDNYPWHCM